MTADNLQFEKASLPIRVNDAGKVIFEIPVFANALSEMYFIVRQSLLGDLARAVRAQPERVEAAGESECAGRGAEPVQRFV